MKIIILRKWTPNLLRELLQSRLQCLHDNPGVYKVEYSPPRWGGNKIKRFGDGEENQKFEKKKKENF